MIHPVNPGIIEFSSETAPIFFLAGEDDDLESIKCARSWAGLRNRIRFFRQTDFAIAMLQGALFSSHPEEATPLMVIIKRPASTWFGLDLLNWLRSNASLHEVPVLVLADASHAYDVKRCLDLGANACWDAPETMEAWIQFFSNIKTAFETAESRALAIDN